MTKLQALPVAAIFVIIAVNLALIPQYTRAYTMGRLVSSPVRALAIYFNADAGAPSPPLVTQQQSLGRELRPFLDVPDRLIFAGGRPARLDPLPELLDTPLIYIQSADDGETILQHLETEHDCPQRLQLASWTLWYCNGAAPQPIAHFGGNLQLLRASISNRSNDSIHLTLFWVAEQQVEADYTAFIHVVDSNDQIVGQWDQLPGSGAPSTQPPRSTRQWDIQTIVVDDYQISLPPTRAAMPWRVWAGLYDAQTGERLPISQSERPINENRLELMTLPPR